jgi:hypothetical protein
MMFGCVAREKALSRRCDVRMPDIRQDERRSALLRMLYYAHPDLVCTPFNPQTDHPVDYAGSTSIEYINVLTCDEAFPWHATIYSSHLPLCQAYNIGNICSCRHEKRVS